MKQWNKKIRLNLPLNWLLVMLTDPQHFEYNREGRAISLAVQIKDTSWQLTVSAEEKHHSPWALSPTSCGWFHDQILLSYRWAFLKPRVFVSKSSTTWRAIGEKRSWEETRHLAKILPTNPQSQAHPASKAPDTLFNQELHSSPVKRLKIWGTGRFTEPAGQCTPSFQI